MKKNSNKLGCTRYCDLAFSAINKNKGKKKKICFPSQSHFKKMKLNRENKKTHSECGKKERKHKSRFSIHERHHSKVDLTSDKSNFVSQKGKRKFSQ